MAPRPILKRPPQQGQHHQHQHSQTHSHSAQAHLHTAPATHHQLTHPFPFAAPAVHFPPSPSLTRTFTAYSAQAYDRSPIVVAPNSCALPERGCPGRTYTLDEQASPTPAPRCITAARDYHPRALAFASATNAAATSSYAPVPPLIPDLSSESEESDGVAAQLPVQAYHSYPAVVGSPNAKAFTSSPPNSAMYATMRDPAINHHDDGDDEDDEATHTSTSPSSPKRAGFRLRYTHAPSYASPNEDDAPAAVASQYPRRRRERRHESSRDPDRIPGGEVLGLSLAGLSLSSSSSSSSSYPPSTPSPNSSYSSSSSYPSNSYTPSTSSPSNHTPTSLTSPCASAYAYAPSSPTSPSPSPRKKGVRRQHAGALVVPPLASAGGGGFGVDDGCLGGF